LREFVKQGWHEATLFLQTTVGFTVAPRRFTLCWAEGSQPAMNPLVVMGTSAALIASLDQFAAPAYGGVGSSQSLWAGWIEGLLPYSYYAALALVCHVVLRATRSNARWSSSVAVALFGGAGPMTFSQLFASALLALLGWGGRMHDAPPGSGIAFRLPHLDFFLVLAVLIAGVVQFVVCVASALAALHDKRPLPIAAMIIVAMLLIGALPGHQHLHILHIGIARGSRGLPVPDLYWR
jgi:hypothetical protein